MKRIYFFIITFFTCSFSAVAQDDFVSVGSGGGFAGTATVYKITPRGEVFKGNGVGDIKFTLCGKIKKAKAKQIIASITDQTRSASPFSYPGNLYYFMAYNKNSNEQAITWGDADHPAPEHIKKLYEEVQASVTAVKYKPIK